MPYYSTLENIIIPKIESNDISAPKKIEEDGYSSLLLLNVIPVLESFFLAILTYIFAHAIHSLCSHFRKNLVHRLLKQREVRISEFYLA